MIDATHLKAHRTAASLLKRGLFPDVSADVVSALLVITSALPHRKAAARLVESVWRTTTRGVRIYLKTLRLAGLLAVTLAAAAGSAMVIVNTVVIVRGMGGFAAGPGAGAGHL